MRDRFVFDLDGTLASVEHRRQMLFGAEPDWSSFSKSSLFDKPNEAVACVARALHGSKQGYEIWIVSGRSDVVERETRGWLAKYSIPFHKLLLRAASDGRSDVEVKREWAEKYDFANCVIAVFDDRSRVVSMWRSLGIQCFQVDVGDY